MRQDPSRRSSICRRTLATQHQVRTAKVAISNFESSTQTCLRRSARNFGATVPSCEYLASVPAACGWEHGVAERARAFPSQGLGALLQCNATFVRGIQACITSNVELQPSRNLNACVSSHVSRCNADSALAAKRHRKSLDECPVDTVYSFAAGSCLFVNEL